MTKKIALSIVSTALAFSFAACGDTSENPSATVTVTEQAEPNLGQSGDISDEQFADVVRSETDSFDDSSTSDIVDAAKAVCRYWEMGADIEDMIYRVIDSGMDTYDGGFLVGAATEAYCPEYSDKIEDLGSGNSI